jgi:hypothetical protein
MPILCLTSVEEEKIEKWIRKLNRKRKKADQTNSSYIDIHVSRASGIGESYTAKDRITGETLDLTDYSNW